MIADPCPTAARFDALSERQQADVDALFLARDGRDLLAELRDPATFNVEFWAERLAEHDARLIERLEVTR